MMTERYDRPAPGGRRASLFPILSAAFLLGAFLLAALAAGTARAQAETASPAAEPTRTADGRLEGCTIRRPLDGDGVPGFGMSAKREVTMTVRNPAFGLTPGQRYDATAEVRGRLVKAPAVALAPDAARLDIPSDEAFLAELRNAHIAFVGGLGGQTIVPLPGAGAALDALRACVEREVAARPAPPPPAPSGKGLRVDLGTYGSEAAARATWERLARAHRALLAGRTPFFERTERRKDGRAFILLRGSGFPDRAAADGFCKAVRSKAQDCAVLER